MEESVTLSNSSTWPESKFVRVKGKWRASRDRTEVSAGSRIAADLAVDGYSRALQSYARGRLVDIGAGKAPLRGCYEPLVNSVVLVDWGKTFGEDGAIPNVEADLNLALPFDSGAFDTILCSDVLEHIWNHRTFTRELSRILSPGGVLILGTPFMYWLHEEPYDYFRWSPYALRQMCSENSLKVVSLSSMGDGFDVLADISGKMLNSLSSRLAGLYADACNTGLRRRRRVREPEESKFPLSLLLVATKVGDGEGSC